MPSVGFSICQSTAPTRPMVSFNICMPYTLLNLANSRMFRAGCLSVVLLMYIYALKFIACIYASKIVGLAPKGARNTALLFVYDYSIS